MFLYFFVGLIRLSVVGTAINFEAALEDDVGLAKAYILVSCYCLTRVDWFSFLGNEEQGSEVHGSEGIQA